MEENKTNVVNMKSEDQNPKKMSYEELENVAHQLSEQAKTLYAKLQESNMENTFMRLNYLFKVVDNSTKAFSKEFVSDCAKEIESMMIIKNEPVENTVEK